MKVFRILAFLLVFPVVVSAATLRGVVRAIDGHPVANANIDVNGHRATTDAEDMATYFADFPDLARSLQSIQVQRGVGTSTVGSPSFGGSVNLESIAPAGNESTDAELGIGSFGTKTATVGYQSGALPGGYAFYTRLSADQSNGFRK